MATPSDRAGKADEEALLLAAVGTIVLVAVAVLVVEVPPGPDPPALPRLPVFSTGDNTPIPTFPIAPLPLPRTDDDNEDVAF